MSRDNSGIPHDCRCEVCQATLSELSGLKLQVDDLKRRLIARINKDSNVTMLSKKELESADPSKFSLVEELVQDTSYITLKEEDDD